MYDSATAPLSRESSNMAATLVHNQVSIIGAGPAGLMAAEQLSNAGFKVEIYDAMPSVGRKFLRAGIGGLNLTHAEDKAQFVSRFAEQHATVGKWLEAFDAQQVREWAAGLGIDTFVGSSGRVFPTQMKAAPLLRAWLKRLRANGCTIHARHRWVGWDKQQLVIRSPEQTLHINSNAVIFALGGGSWAKLGSDGQWLTLFQQAGLACTPLKPSNCGFNAHWRDDFVQSQQGKPLKSVRLSVTDQNNKTWSRQGDAVISRHGIEGGLVYALSAPIREQILAQGSCEVYWDLLPDRSLEQIEAAVNNKRAKNSLSSFLKKGLKLDRSKQALLNQLTSKEQVRDLTQLPKLLKRLPQTLNSCRPVDEAISTAGGLGFSQVTPELMLKDRPGYFCVGEMLDWEAPTGGYLLTACFASGWVAGQAACEWLNAPAGAS